MGTSDLRTWALKGAEQRLVELAGEAKAIFAAFPELRARGRGFDVAASGPREGKEPTQGAAPRRRRRKMSAEARKRIGDAQRARWAARRQSESTSATPAIVASGAKSTGRKRGRAAAKRG